LQQALKEDALINVLMKAYQLVKLPLVLNKLSVHLFPAKKVGLQELVPTLVVGNVTV